MVLAQVYRPDRRQTAHHQVQGIGQGKPNLLISRGVAEQGPRDRGYRCMAVVHDRRLGSNVLYVSTLSHWVSRLLRSVDGRHFDAASEPGLGKPDVLSFRALTAFKDKLFVGPAGSVDSEVMDRNFGEIARLYVADDPESGKWEEAMPPGFGDPDNKSIFSMAVFNHFLYAGTGNPARGFQLWKTRAEGDPPYQWTPVIDDGAARYNLNETATTMVVFNDSLYIGSGLPGLGYDKANDVGPGAAELIRVNADDSWDLLIGAPRFSPAGLKVPLAVFGPGFDDPYNSVFWSMAIHNGNLYVGTHHWESWQVALSGGKTMKGGFQLWGTEDGENWELITADGFGNPFSHGVRTLVSSPHGLFLGTSTHREIERLWFRLSDQRGRTPGTGGLEIWCGGLSA